MSAVYSLAKNIALSYLQGFSSGTVIFDIDDTLINSINGRTIKEIYNILEFCTNKKFRIIIITARSSKYTNETIEQLKTKKIYYDELYLDNGKDKNFKYTLKNKFKDVIFMIGDQCWDMSGYYKKALGIKLPENNSNSTKNLIISFNEKN